MPQLSLPAERDSASTVKCREKARRPAQLYRFSSREPMEL
jgi:hypothetical protein